MGLALAQNGNGAARITVTALRRLLGRLGYYGSVEDAFVRWAEFSVPVGLRPVSLQIEDAHALVMPIPALDLLIEQGASKESPWVGVLWGALGTVGGRTVQAAGRC